MEDELDELDMYDDSTPSGSVGYDRDGPIQYQVPGNAEGGTDIDFDTRTPTEQVVENTGNILKYNASKYAGLINAGIANMNESIGIDSSIFRENQAFWKESAVTSKDELAMTYGEGITRDVITEVGNPLNYTLASGLGKLGTVTGVDAMAEQSIQDSTFDEAVTATAIASGAGIIAGKYLPIVAEELGNQAKRFNDWSRTMGLPEPLRVALAQGDDEKLRGLLQEFKVSKRMQANDLPYGGGNAETRNTYEAVRAASERGPIQEIERKSVKVANSILNTKEASEVTSDELYNAVKSKEKLLKDPMTAAYDNSIHKASTEKQFDMDVINDRIIKQIELETNYDPSVKHVIKNLYHQELKAKTPYQKSQQRKSDNLTKSIDEIEMRLDVADYPGQQGGLLKANDEAKLGAQKRQRAIVDKTLPDEDPLRSEKDIINAIRGIQHKLNSPGGSVDQSGEAHLILARAKQLLSKEAETLFDLVGSNIFKELKRANGLANKYYKYTGSMQEISMLLKSDQAVPEEIMLNLLQNPARMKHLLDVLGKGEGDELGAKLAMQSVSQLARPRTIPVAGALEKLDMITTSRTLDNIFSDKQITAFYRKHLPPGKFEDIVALKNVTASFNEVTADFPEAVAGMDYIKGADGVVNKAGRFVKTLWDMGGVMKNDVIAITGANPQGKLLKSSRVTANSDIIDKAGKIISKRLAERKKLAEKAGVISGWAGPPKLTSEEGNIVGKAIEHMEAVTKSYIPKGGQ